MTDASFGLLMMHLSFIRLTWRLTLANASFQPKKVSALHRMLRRLVRHQYPCGKSPSWPTLYPLPRQWVQYLQQPPRRPLSNFSLSLAARWLIVARVHAAGSSRGDHDDGSTSMGRSVRHHGSRDWRSHSDSNFSLVNQLCPPHFVSVGRSRVQQRC